MGEKMTSRPRLPVFFASILVLVLGIWVFSGQAGETFLIKGAKVYTSSSRGTLEDAVLLIEGGKIGKIIRGDALPSFPVKDFSGTCIMPGMIDAHTYLSGYYRLLENTEPITSDMVAYAAFDPFHSEVRNALQSGITTVQFTPRNENLVGGISSVFKLNRGFKSLPLLKERAFLKISFCGEMIRSDRAPTSLMGAERILSEKMRELEENGGGPRTAVFQQKGLLALLRGDLRPLIAASTLEEVNTALRWMAEWDIKGVIVGGEEAHLLVGFLKEKEIPVLFLPILPSYPERYAKNAALLVREGIKAAFVSYMPEAGPLSLRMSALMLYRQGILQEEALKTITLAPAEILGVDDSVGSIEEGKDADLVVFSGEPLDLSSRIVAVYVDGQPVFEREK
jgi:imidazolonepropionase-like amidohydrolase